MPLPGGRTATPAEFQEAAKMAVQLTSMLVLWFAIGLIRRRH